MKNQAKSISKKSKLSFKSKETPYQIKFKRIKFSTIRLKVYQTLITNLML